MLFFEFLQTEVSSCLVVTHVIIPSTREFKELGSLGRLNCYQLLFLSLLHVLKLTKHFLVFEIFKLQSSSSGFSQVHFFAAFFTVIVKETEKVDNFAVGKEVNTSAGQETPVLGSLLVGSFLRHHVINLVSWILLYLIWLQLMLLTSNKSVLKVFHNAQKLFKAHLTIGVKVEFLEKINSLLRISP